MQKWEYCAVVGISSSSIATKLDTRYPGVINFTNQGGQITEIRQTFLDKNITGSKDATERKGVAKAISRLGEDGWELVGVGKTGECFHTLYFKRPKE